MKIGIITYWMSEDNYGGILQTYALQRYLRNQGHDAYVIRFHRDFNLSLSFKLRRCLRMFLEGLHLLKRKPCYSNNEKILQWNKQRDFDSFRMSKIALSDVEYQSVADLRQCPPYADVYITGSDQVWSVDLSLSENSVFFLDFGPSTSKRISYAASFGYSFFPCKDESKFTKLLKRFNAISVRENQGIEICRKYGYNAIRCLDSTLLLDFDDYKKLIVNRTHDNPYAFFYTVNVSTAEEIFWHEIRSLLEGKDIEPIVTTGSGYRPAEEIFEGAIYDYATVEEWLTNIYYSKIFITSSFHGVVFAIILQKDFIYIPLKGHLGSGNNRIYDLLASCGLNDRVADSYDKICHLFDKSIDYSSLKNDGFKMLKKESITFLNNI